jgi:hypothetical protein
MQNIMLIFQAKRKTGSFAYNLFCCCEKPLHLCSLELQYLKKMTFKQKIYSHYLQMVQDRIDVFKDMISALTEDSKNDAKGSAGDKHETALSMMHIEQEKLTNKLKEAIAQKAILDKIDASKTTENIISGSLVKANGIYLYLSVALPKISIDGINVIALSPQSPLGTHLMGNKAGFQFEINKTHYTIESVE